MLFFSTIKIALDEIAANKFRSLLTTLGIVIAVAAVIAVVSIVQGASKFMLDQVAGLGSNSIWVFRQRPPGQRGRALGRIDLTYEDGVAIAEECEAVERASPVLGVSAAVKYRSTQSSDIEISGTTPDYHSISNQFVVVGRSFSAIDIGTCAEVCVVGTEVLKKLNMGREDAEGKEIIVRNRLFKVIGILEEKGASFGRSKDNTILIPVTTAMKHWGRMMRMRVMIMAQAKEKRTEEAIDQITYLLRVRHKRHLGDPNDFQILTQDQILAFFQQMSIVVTGLTMGVVGISLIVGGIGIMNIMLVSVSERTREIGIRKALGAKNTYIMFQFLVEAMALGLMGGILGLLLGMAVGRFAYEVVSIWIDFPPLYTPLWSVVLAFGFSTLVGLVSGLYPAWKAAQLDPIEALRYE